MKTFLPKRQPFKRNLQKEVNNNETQTFSPYFKAFCFILYKLDTIHEIITSSNQNSCYHLHLIQNPNEEVIFKNIQTVLNDLISILQTKFKSKSLPSNNISQNENESPSNLFQLLNIIETGNSYFDENEFHLNVTKNKNKKRSISQHKNNLDNEIEIINSQLPMTERNRSSQNELNIKEAPDIESFDNKAIIHKLSNKTENQDLVKVVTHNNICEKEITAMIELLHNGIVIGTKDGIVCALNMKYSSNSEYKIIYEKQVHSDRISFICKFKDKQIITSSYDGHISILSISSNGINIEYFVKAHQEYIRKVIKFNNDYIISCGSDFIIRFSNPSNPNNKNSNFILKEQSDVYCIIKLEQTEGNILVSSCQDASIGFWNLQTQKKVYAIHNVYTFSPNGMIELPNGMFAVAHYDVPYSIKIVDPLTYVITREIQGGNLIKVNASLCLRNNKSLCCVSDNVYCQIALKDFSLECQNEYTGAKGNLGVVVTEREKYILIPNNSKGINIYSLKENDDDF